MLVFRELKNCLFLITGILEYFLPRAKIDNHNIEIDGRNFMASQLMTQLSTIMKSEKYQQDKVMITQLVAY